MKKTERILLALVLILIAALAWYVFGGSLCRRTTPTAAPTMVAASMPMTRVDITFKLVRLNEQRERVYRDLNAANGALDDVRKAYGFSNLEEDSYPDPFTSRLVRLELEKDNCRLEIMELEANVENLKKQQGEDTTNDELKAKLRDSQDKLV